MAQRQAPKSRGRAGSRPRARPRRDEILQAVRSLVARDGLAGLTALKVAAEVPISEASIFYHFSTMEVLLAETALSVLDEEVASLVRLAEQAPSGIDAALSILRGRLELYRDQPLLIDLVHVHGLTRMSEEQRERAIGLVNGVFDALEAKFPRSRREGDLRRRLGSLWLLSEGLLLQQRQIAVGKLTTKATSQAILEDAMAFARAGLER